MNKKRISKRPRPNRGPITIRPAGHNATEPNDPMIALANSAGSPARRMLTPEELVKLVEKMCAAKGPQKNKLLIRIMEGFYGRRMLPEELHSVALDPAVDQEWIEKIRTGEAREII